MSLAPVRPLFAAPLPLPGRQPTAVEVLWRGLDAALKNQPASARVVVMTVPAPELTLGAALHWFGDHKERLVWAPAEGPAFVGAGETLRVDPEARAQSPIGEGFELGAAKLWPGVYHAQHDEVDGFRLRMFGGLAFSSGSVGPPWQDFGHGFFVLPKWLYRRTAAGASLSLAVEVPADRQELEAQIEALTQRLDSAFSPTGAQPKVFTSKVPGAREVDPTDRMFDQNSHDEWVDLILPLRDDIRADGALDKVVAARYGEVEVQGDFDLEAVLSRLGRGASTCTRFAFLRGESIFFGATPERLVRKQGLEVETEALAGSIPIDAAVGTVASLSERLFGSAKELHEHKLVVQHIVERLEPWSEELTASAGPVVRELRDVLHLETPIVARLKGPRHILELVSRLHPTPAVGGVPIERAVDWIEKVEALPRGWYAGPIGWFDEQGDGDFYVALRSCLLREGRARVYAGAGIVDASDPELEWRETEVKQASVLEALGDPGPSAS